MNTIKNIDGKKLAIDVLYDIIGGIFIALGAYNFAAAAHFPLVGFTGIALITHHLFGLPIGAVSIALNIPVAIICYKILVLPFEGALRGNKLVCVPVGRGRPQRSGAEGKAFPLVLSQKRLHCRLF